VPNIFNLIEWRFDFLIPAPSRQSGVFVNPRMATLRGPLEMSVTLSADHLVFPVLSCNVH
jgi:hypothetical protein